MKHVTYVKLVLDALRADPEEFMTRQMLVQATGATDGQVSAALHWLRKAQCVDVVINPDGMGWWFALPPEMDVRQRAPNETTFARRPGRSRFWTRVKPKEPKP